MIRRSFCTLALATAVSTFATGCFRGPVEPPTVPLERSEQRRVMACERTLSRQVSKLSSKVYGQLHGCAADALDLRLEEERELNSTNIAEYVAKRESLRERCETAYERAGVATTRMIDVVLRRCRDVEPQVLTDPLRGDPLGFKGELDFGDLFTAPDVPDVETLASNLCGLAVSSAEMLLSFSLPRIGDLSDAYYGIDDEDAFRLFWHDFLDPRCGTALSPL